MSSRPMDKYKRDLLLFEIGSKTLWPAFRNFCNKSLSRRCSECILSENYIKIDETGVCSLCRESARSDAASREVSQDDSMKTELDSILKDLKGEEQYDALVLFSGGKDSSLILHELQSKYPGLRLLALTVDNFFLSPLAHPNIEQGLKHFSIPHLTYRAPWSVVKKLFRHSLTQIHRDDHYPPTDLMDGHLTSYCGFQLARTLKIPAIITGLARAQCQSVLGIHSFTAEIEDLIHVQTQKVNFLETTGYSLPPKLNEESGTSQPPFFLFPLYAWNFAESDIVERIDKLGLLKKNQSSPVATNNQLILVASLGEVANFGFTKFEIEFAKMIRNGKAQRKVWLNIFEMLEFSAQKASLISKSVDEVLHKLDLQRSDLGVPG